MKAPSVPTGSFKDLVQSRTKCDLALKAELLREGRGKSTSLAKANLGRVDGIRWVGTMPDLSNIQLIIIGL